MKVGVGEKENEEVEGAITGESTWKGLDVGVAGPGVGTTTGPRPLVGNMRVATSGVCVLGSANCWPLHILYALPTYSTVVWSAPSRVFR